MMNRRALISGGVAGTISAAFSSNAAQASALQAEPAKILNQQPGMKYRQLGKTGLLVSEISLGALVIEEAVLNYGIEQGVNLVHVAWEYLGGRAIRILGEVMKTKRDKVYLAIKDDFRNIDDALKILNTDHVDILMFNRHDAASAKDPKMMDTFESLKKQGKVRFSGLTTHGDVKGSLASGLSMNCFDVFMPVLNQPSLEAVGEELRAAHEKQIGVLAMKTMKGIEAGTEVETAYLKKVLRNPAVASVTKGFGSYDMFDAYLAALGEPLTAAEDRLLYRHAQANRRSNCMMCDECRRACPDGVEISTVLRCRDYYYGQMHDVETAAATYGGVPQERRGGEQCRDCRRCEMACPNGIDIVARLEAARGTFGVSA